MDITTTNIIIHLQNKSGGSVKIDKQTAQEIVDIVNRVKRESHCYVNIMQWDGQLQNYRHYRTLYTTPEAMKNEIIKALERKPVYEFYLYECFNQDKEFEGRIYCSNPNIFNK